MNHLSLSDLMVPPPSPGTNVCPNCRAWKSSEFPTCWNCSTWREEYGISIPILPMAIYSRQSALRDIVATYKPGREVYREESRKTLREVVDAFIVLNQKPLRLAFDRFDQVLAVPMNHGGENEFRYVFDGFIREFTTAREMEKANANDRKSSLRRVLIIDDVYTSGRHVHRFANDLRSRGLVPAGAIVIARRYNPEWNPEVMKIWETQIGFPRNGLLRDPWFETIESS